MIAVIIVWLSFIQMRLGAPADPYRRIGTPSLSLFLSLSPYNKYIILSIVGCMRDTT